MTRKIKENELKQFPFTEEFVKGNDKVVHIYINEKEYTNKQGFDKKLFKLTEAIDEMIEELQDTNIIILVEINNELFLELNEVEND